MVQYYLVSLPLVGGNIPLAPTETGYYGGATRGYAEGGMYGGRMSGYRY